MTVRAARRIPDLKPGDDAWVKIMTASKVASVLGLSPWESRFSLYYRMSGQLPHDEGNEATRRGTYLEDAVCRWWAEQRTDVRIGKTGSWVNKARPWQSATPDRLVWSGRRVTALLEAKTSAKPEEWGRQETDEVPPYYRAQVIWQLDTLGLKVAHIAVLLSNLRFASYTIHYDADEAAWIRQEVSDFLDTLPGGPNETPPDIDEHDATYEAVRRLHPDIEERDVDVTPEFALEFIGAVRDSKVSQSLEQEVKARMLDHMGSAKRAVLPREGRAPLVIATRQAKGQGVPYVSAPRKLPEDLEMLGV